MNTFFIADTHFGHANCIDFDDRPFSNVDEMDNEIIQRWNKKVGENDDVYIVGDFAYRNNRPVRHYTSRLNGHLHLIRGNHDQINEETLNCFEEIRDMKEIKVPLYGTERRVFMCHYFIPNYPGSRYQAIHLHGHSHQGGGSRIEEDIKRLMTARGEWCFAVNVGCMYQDSEPQTLEEIVERSGEGLDAYRSMQEWHDKHLLKEGAMATLFYMDDRGRISSTEAATELGWTIDEYFARKTEFERGDKTFNSMCR